MNSGDIAPATMQLLPPLYDPAMKRKVRRSVVFRVTVIFLAAAYGVALASLPLGVFLDRQNYLIYAEHSWAMLSMRAGEGVLSLLANEPVWLLINSGLALVLSPEWILRLIICIPAFVVARYAMRRDQQVLLWAVLFLLVPQVIKNHIIHLRQGIAVAVFLVAWFSPGRMTRWPLFALTPFIHSAFFFVLGLMFLTGLVRGMRLAIHLRVFVYAAASLVIAGSLAWLAAAVGARQASEYQFSATGVSGAGFVFWAALFALMCLEGKAYARNHTLELGSMIFYLGTYFMIEVTARIFESTLLLVLLAGLQLTGWRRQMFLLAVVFYTLYSYYLRMGTPWLAWGLTQ